MTTCMEIEADYSIGGGWGDCIEWSGHDQFDSTPIADGAIFKLHGWKQNIPTQGQTLKAEFRKSWMIFEFKEVKSCRDPHDMFFAKVTPVQQILK